jgi:hypothetical protein
MTLAKYTAAMIAKLMFHVAATFVDATRILISASLFLKRSHVRNMRNIM